MQDVVGARFRCIDCTNIEVDICSNCEAAGLPGNLDSSDGGHISSHVMLKVLRKLYVELPCTIVLTHYIKFNSFRPH